MENIQGKEDKYLVRQTGIDLVHILAQQEELEENQDSTSASATTILHCLTTFKEEEAKEKKEEEGRICKSVRLDEPGVVLPPPSRPRPVSSSSSSSSRKSDPGLDIPMPPVLLPFTSVHEETPTNLSLIRLTPQKSTVADSSSSQSEKARKRARQRNNPISDEQSIISETEPLISSHEKMGRNPYSRATSLEDEQEVEEGFSRSLSFRRNEEGEEKTIRTVLKDLFSGENPHNYSPSPGMTTRFYFYVLLLSPFVL
jgi:hypothetical protein